VRLPQAIVLSQNYPNPFNPETTVAFQLPAGSDISISIHNLLGEDIDTLVSGYHEPGFYTIRWNGTDRNGNRVPSGMYLYSLTAAQTILQKTMLLLR
jgi:flagellar hook assembly protein FlgD